jgi:hypothetical protein
VSITAEPVTTPRRRNRPPEFTERDGAALQWLGEQYGARLDVLGVLLGRLGGHDQPLSKWGVRKQIERWQRQRLVITERALGDTWVTPTRYGLDRAGLPANLPTWKVPVTRVRHCHAVNVLRLWYEGRPAAAVAPWVSERMSYLERGKEHTWHVADGVVKDPRSADETGPPRYIAIEVELEHKGRRRYETEVFGKLRSGIGTVWYFVPDEAFRRRLGDDIDVVRDRQGFTTPCRIDLLPEVPGVSYMTNR